MKTKDMTRGKPLRLLLTFGLPLMLGNIFQQLYTVVDASIVGQGIGLTALAAVGAADWFNWLFLSIVQGFAQGFSIPIAHAFGAKDYQELRRSIGNAAMLAVGLSIVITSLALALHYPILRLMGTPDDIIHSSASYLSVIFAGLPLAMLYNLTASILRALGDSKTPLYAMIISTTTNILLDLLFVIVLKWGIVSAAIATVIAEAASGFFCLFRLSRIEIAHISRGDLRLERPRSLHLMALGLPVSLQNAIIAIGGMIVQSAVNQYDRVFIAGYTATNKLYGVLEIAAVSFGYAMSTYCGQNLGARRKDRICHGVHVGLGLGIVTSMIVAGIMLLLGHFFNALFIEQGTPSTEEAMRYAWEFLRDMSVTLPILYALHVYRNALHGLGNTVTPMISGIAEFVMRTGAALLLPAIVGYAGVFYAEILAWLGADLILIPGYYLMIRKLRMPDRPVAIETASDA